MSIDRALNFDDLRAIAKRKLPKIVFDFVDGGVEDETCLARNRSAFQDYRLLPHYLVDVSKRDQSVSLFGRRYNSPFGISPMGLAGLAYPGVDLLLAKAAAEANVPYLMSNASNATIEAAAAVAPHNTWFQIYATTDERINIDLVRRARDLALETLVVTVDVPVNSNRERNRRNGFSRPPKMTLAVFLESLLHPRWVARFILSGGIPAMENWGVYAPPGSGRDGGGDLYGTLTPAPSMTWARLEEIRSRWSGNLVVKGILSPADAVRAVEAGANGVILSNHGGRQLDAAPSPLDVLPAVRAAIGERAEILLDSGVRRGSDILIALALGARLTLFGRPMLFGAAAGGEEGVRHALALMRREVDIVMGQIGVPELAAIGSHSLWPPGS
jgi:(S)-mandelate dehydrogenase